MGGSAAPLAPAAAVVLSVAIAVCSLWAGCALFYRLSGRAGVKFARLAAWVAGCVTLQIVLWRGAAVPAAALFAVAFAALCVWWHRQRPTNAADWADDVARMTAGTVADERVVLHNVRNFEWRTLQDYTVRWETRSYDLARLRSVDMVMSYWRGPAIAHMLISFGFRGRAGAAPEQIVFSVEVRRRKTQAFSEIGGFFKEFELSIIAADERDVIRLRTNVRGEDVYLYRLRLPVAAMRLLFLGYLGEANALLEQPRFYNTVTVNCTTLVYHMMKRIVGRLPFDYRLLFSGYLPEYVYGVGGMGRRRPLEQLRARGRITERARRADRSPNFSRDIRRGSLNCE